MQQSRPRAYEQRLRTIGSRLDSGGYHSVSIIEVDGGLIVRASAPGSRTPEVLEIADVDHSHIAQLAPMRGGVPHRLFPDGYKGFLAAMGQRLDRSQAAAIAIVEGTDFVTIGGIQPVAEEDGGLAYEPLDILLLADDVRKLVVEEEPELPEEPPTPTADTPPTTGSDSLADAVLHRVSTVADSARRMVSPARNAARSRG